MTAERITEVPINENFNENIEFCEAVEDFDFTKLKKMNLDAEHQTYAAGIKLITEGKLDEAKEKFKELYYHSRNYLLYKQSQHILENMLLYQQHWVELLELSPNSSIVRAMRNQSGETYVFPSAPVVQPITDDSHVLITCEVNGKEGKFVLDTGASITIINNKFAKQSGLKPVNEAKIKLSTVTSTKFDTELTVINELKIGELLIKNHLATILQATILQYEDDKFADGVLGWNAIKNLDICLDYKKRKITIGKPIKDTNSKGNLFCWPPFNLPIVVLNAETGNQCEFLLDTGAYSSNVSEKLIDKLDTKTIKRRNVLEGIGDSEMYEQLAVPELTLHLGKDVLTLKNIGTDIKSKFDGTLGLDIVQEAVMRLDYSNGIFTIEYFSEPMITCKSLEAYCFLRHSMSSPDLNLSLFFSIFLS